MFRLIHKFWGWALGIPEPPPRLPKLKIGAVVREKAQSLQNKIHWKIADWEVTEHVDEHMANLRTTSWWPAKWEAFGHINDQWEDWEG